MAALVAAIHAFSSEIAWLQPRLLIGPKDVDGRHKAGHDDQRMMSLVRPFIADALEIDAFQWSIGQQCFETFDGAWRESFE